MPANKDLRKIARECRVPFWVIADVMKISEPTMTRKLRHELSDVEKQKIISIIHECSNKEVDSSENENN